MEIKNKKQILTTLISVLVSVFLVTTAVYAVTTIGNDVSVGENLTVGGEIIGYVPYTGATADVDLGQFSLTTSSLYMAGGIDFTAGNLMLNNGNEEPGILQIAKTGGAGVFLDINSLTDDRTFVFPDASGTLALAENVVPYTGATGDVDFGVYDLAATEVNPIDEINFSGLSGGLITVPKYKSLTLEAGNGDGDTAAGHIILNLGTGTGSQDGYLKLHSVISGIDAILDIHSLATADKTFTFPDQSGTFIIADSGTGNVGIGTTTPNSLLSVAGPIATAIANKTAAYTITANDSTITCDATTGAFTITLPTASGIAGRIYTIKKIDSSANAITIDGSGAETIDGAATYSLGVQWKYAGIVSDGSNWIVVANN